MLSWKKENLLKKEIRGRKINPISQIECTVDDRILNDLNQNYAEI